MNHENGENPARSNNPVGPDVRNENSLQLPRSSQQTPGTPPRTSGQQQQRRPPTRSRWAHHRKRLLRTTLIILVLALTISSWAIYRSFELAIESQHGYVWKDELAKGNYLEAFTHFIGLTNDAMSQIMDHELSLERVSSDIKSTLPYLKKAGYTLTEVDVELGIPPRGFVHFHHHGTAHVDVDQALAAMDHNLIGKALILAIAQAGKLQEKVEDSDMPFNHVEVELAPIPSVKVEYISPSKLHPWGNEAEH